MWFLLGFMSMCLNVSTLDTTNKKQHIDQKQHTFFTSFRLSDAILSTIFYHTGLVRMFPNSWRKKSTRKDSAGRNLWTIASSHRWKHLHHFKIPMHKLQRQPLVHRRIEREIKVSIMQNSSSVCVLVKSTKCIK